MENNMKVKDKIKDHFPIVWNIGCLNCKAGDFNKGTCPLNPTDVCATRWKYIGKIFVIIDGCKTHGSIITNWDWFWEKDWFYKRDEE